MARLNVQTVTESSLNKMEQQILHHIQQEVFDKLSVHNWEGIEVIRYCQDPQKFANFFRNEPTKKELN